MVEYTPGIDSLFAALTDPVRRDIFERTTDDELTVNQIALEYDMSLAAVSKHLKVLQEANLIRKRRDGRYIFVRSTPGGLRDAAEYMRQFDQFLQEV